MDSDFIKTCLNDIEENSNYANFTISKSIVGKKISKLYEKKTIDFVNGFRSYYFINSVAFSYSGEELNGYLYAHELRFPLNRAPQEIKDRLLDMENMISKGEEFMKELEAWQNDFFNSTKGNEDKRNKDFNDLLDKMENEKRKLMLSGPIEIWYGKLATYTGKKYELKKGKKFEYSEKMKRGWIRGRIKLNIFFTIIWAILGMGAIFVFFILVLLEIESVTNLKSLTLISIFGSFFLFIYGYVLKIFVKNWLSARHISESIQERIALTQFYLSLIQQNEKGEESKQIDDLDRTYAIKAIFERINTGLIKNGHDDFNMQFLMDNIKKK